MITKATTHKTITTKQLRDNMADIVRDLQSGKHIQLSYRHKIIGTLQPLSNVDETPRRGSPAALAQFLKTVDYGLIPDKVRNDKRTIKQQLAQLRDTDPKFQ